MKFTFSTQQWQRLQSLFEQAEGMDAAAAAAATLSGYILLPAFMSITMGDVGVHWLFLLCLSATLLCWLLTLPIVRRTWQSA